MNETNGSWINKHTITSAGGIVVAILALYLWNASLARSDEQVGSQLTSLEDKSADTAEILAGIKEVLVQNAVIMKETTKALERNTDAWNRIFSGGKIQ